MTAPYTGVSKTAHFPTAPPPHTTKRLISGVLLQINQWKVLQKIIHLERVTNSALSQTISL
jgi:hypothetical protein